MKLQILIPQYKETQEIIKPMLDSLQTQQGINFNEFSVVVANDGSNVIIPDEFFEQYSFKIDYHLLPHVGVSGVRNFCLSQATADYVMFCDADDMFLSNAGLWLIFNEIEKGFDVFISTFSEEQKIEGKSQFINHENDATFVHGKVYRRQYLLENNIWFNKDLTIHEDSYFNYLARICAEEKNIRCCKNVFYLWKYREDSICRQEKTYLFKTYSHMIKSTDYLLNELLKRGKIQNAQVIYINFLYSTYFMMDKDEWQSEEAKKYLNKIYNDMKVFINKYNGIADSMNIVDKNNIIKAARDKKIREGGAAIERISFNEWIRYIDCFD